jgi:exonuclease III
VLKSFFARLTILTIFPYVPPARGASYGEIWHGQKSWNGVAILARAPIRRKPAGAFPAITDTHNYAAC